MAIGMSNRWAFTGCVLLVWQADVDAAFRRVPVAAQDRWACCVAFVVKGSVSLLYKPVWCVHLRVGSLWYAR